MDAGRQALYIVLAIGVVYMLLVFVVHYLDFGWKMLSGEWLHDSLPFVRKIRGGLINRLMVVFFLTILIYGGLSDFLKFLPEKWGWVDEAGVTHPYRRALASLLAFVIAGISVYGCRIADTYFDEKKEQQRQRDARNPRAPLN